MTTNYDELSDRVKERLARSTFDFVGLLVRDLVQNTPVDTGLMQGSWIATVSAQRAAAGNRFFKGTPKTNSVQKSLTNVARMGRGPAESVSVGTGVDVGAAGGQMLDLPQVGATIAAGKPIFVVNTARNPRNQFYYPAVVDDKRQIVRRAAQTASRAANIAFGREGA